MHATLKRTASLVVVMVVTSLYGQEQVSPKFLVSENLSPVLTSLTDARSQYAKAAEAQGTLFTGEDAVRFQSYLDAQRRFLIDGLPGVVIRWSESKADDIIRLHPDERLIKKDDLITVYRLIRSHPAELKSISEAQQKLSAAIAEASKSVRTDARYPKPIADALCHYFASTIDPALPRITDELLTSFELSYPMPPQNGQSVAMMRFATKGLKYSMFERFVTQLEGVGIPISIFEPGTINDVTKLYAAVLADPKFLGTGGRYYVNLDFEAFNKEFIFGKKHVAMTATPRVFTGAGIAQSGTHKVAVPDDNYGLRVPDQSKSSPDVTGFVAAFPQRK